MINIEITISYIYFFDQQTESSETLQNVKRIKAKR